MTSRCGTTFVSCSRKAAGLRSARTPLNSHSSTTFTWKLLANDTEYRRTFFGFPSFLFGFDSEPVLFSMGQCMGLWTLKIMNTKWREEYIFAWSCGRFSSNQLQGTSGSLMPPAMPWSVSCLFALCSSVVWEGQVSLLQCHLLMTNRVLPEVLVKADRVSKGADDPIRRRSCCSGQLNNTGSAAFGKNHVTLTWKDIFSFIRWCFVLP